MKTANSVQEIVELTGLKAKLENAKPPPLSKYQVRLPILARKLCWWGKEGLEQYSSQIAACDVYTARIIRSVLKVKVLKYRIADWRKQ